MADKKEQIVKQISKAMADAKTRTKKTFSFLTADSKKIIIALIFLTSVVLDKVLWDNALYPAKKLFDSNVFRAFALTIAVILTKDVQSIFQGWVEKKVIGKSIKSKK